MSAQHHNLSSYAKLWRLNRQIKKKKIGLRRLEKCVPQNPPLVSKKIVNGVSTMKRLCTSRKRKFNWSLPQSLNRSFNPPKKCQVNS